MLNKLRLQFTQIHMIIMLMLFVLLIGGAYILAQHDLKHRSWFISNLFANDILNGNRIEFPLPPLRDGHMEPPPPLLPRFSVPVIERMPPPKEERGFPKLDLFFVKIDRAGEMMETSKEPLLTAAELLELTQLVKSMNMREGRIVYQQKEYNFVKAELPDEAGWLMVFHDQERERDMLQSLLFGMMAAGTICLILSGFASRFLANRAMIPVEQAWQRQQEFVADASHELRTPLTVIQTTLDVLRCDPQATIASQKKWIDNIAEETVNMTQLVNSLLFLARADANQYVLERQNFSLAAVAEGSAQLFDLLAEKKGIVLTYEKKTDRACMIEGDEKKWKQVFGILLDNAIRHTNEGGRIVLQVAQDQDKVVATLTDTGEGMGAEHLVKIFERFYQVDKSRAAGGAGLGLSIAKWIVNSHGGTIRATSTLGQGTSFIIEVPLKMKR